MAAAGVPRTLEEITPEYLSSIAAKQLKDGSVRVTGFQIEPEPFEYPKFGNKRFDRITYRYQSSRGSGQHRVILRRLPPVDAVMTLTGDTHHRELVAFREGLYGQVPDCFYVPYLDVIHDDAAGQYWAWVDDVSEDMRRLGMTDVMDDATLRTVLSHLARFHARFWEDAETLSRPWLMGLHVPVDYAYRAVVDIMDGMRSPSEATQYIVSQWPWYPTGVLNLMESLPPATRDLVEELFRHPERLLDQVRDMPRTLCHYDFDNRNLGIRHEDGRARTVVIDWEILGEGLSSADVGRLLTYQQPPDMTPYVLYYLGELERHLGRGIDRAQWLKGFELVSVAIWQIVGFLFAAIVNAPDSPLPPEMREAMRPRVYADIAGVEALARRWLT